MPIFKYYTAQGCLVQGFTVFYNLRSKRSVPSGNFFFDLKYKKSKFNKTTWAEWFRLDNVTLLNYEEMLT